VDGQVHFALVSGEVKAGQPTLVRVHLQDTFNDLLATDRVARRSWPLYRAMRKIAEEGGVLVLLGRQQTPNDLIEQVRHFEAEDQGQTQPTATLSNQLRNAGVGSQILSQLGVSKMRLLSSPRKYSSLSGFGLEIVEFIEDTH